MKYLTLLLLVSCLDVKKDEPKIGDCFIGTRMDVWKLMRMDEGKYLFATFPFGEGSPVEVVTDVSALKKVDCPL